MRIGKPVRGLIRNQMRGEEDLITVITMGEERVNVKDLVSSEVDGRLNR